MVPRRSGPANASQMAEGGGPAHAVWPQAPMPASGHAPGIRELRWFEFHLGRVAGGVYHFPCLLEHHHCS